LLKTPRNFYSEEHMTKYPIALNKLITLLKKLPGVGSRTAERFAFHLLQGKQEDLDQLAHSLSLLQKQVHHCPTCRCFKEESACSFCTSPHRDPSKLCVIAAAKDAYLIDATGSYNGFYHVIGGLISPIQGRGSASLDLEALYTRFSQSDIKEVILALDSTLEGDTTSLYLTEELQKRGLAVSRLAFGIPIGSPLDFIDGGTLARAFSHRQHL